MDIVLIIGNEYYQPDWDMIFGIIIAFFCACVAGWHLYWIGRLFWVATGCEYGKFRIANGKIEQIKED